MFLNDAFGRSKRPCATSATTTSRPRRWRPRATPASPAGRRRQRHHRAGRRSTPSTACSAPGPIRFRCWSSPARSSAKPASPRTDLPGLRQLGDQEVDIVRMVQRDHQIRRPGDRPDDDPLSPGAGDVPGHVRSARPLLDRRPGGRAVERDRPDAAARLRPAEDAIRLGPRTVCAQCATVLRPAAVGGQRPVILAGTGVRLARRSTSFARLIRKLGIPVTTAWTHDLIASDDPLFCGRQGSIGDRAGNFTVQNADVLLVLGARLPSARSATTGRPSPATPSRSRWTSTPPS